MKAKPVGEAVAFALGVILYIWVLRFRWPWALGLLALAVVLSLYLHSETVRSVGLGLQELRAALADWKVWLALAAVATALLGGRRILSPALLDRALVYFLWCVAQQAIYQTMVYRRLRQAFGPSWRACVLSGVLFSAVHLPNPVLAPATLVWGAVSSRLFERHPSAPALGLPQFFLSTILLWLTPVEWHRNFRVGASYLQFR